MLCVLTDMVAIGKSQIDVVLKCVGKLLGNSELIEIEQ